MADGSLSDYGLTFKNDYVFTDLSSFDIIMGSEARKKNNLKKRNIKMMLALWALYDHSTLLWFPLLGHEWTII